MIKGTRRTGWRIDSRTGECLLLEEYKYLDEILLAVAAVWRMPIVLEGGEQRVVVVGVPLSRMPIVLEGEQCVLVVGAPKDRSLGALLLFPLARQRRVHLAQSRQLPLTFATQG